jgi:hypothetical protein
MDSLKIRCKTSKAALALGKYLTKSRGFVCCHPSLLVASGNKCVYVFPTTKKWGMCDRHCDFFWPKQKHLILVTIDEALENEPSTK